MTNARTCKRQLKVQRSRFWTVILSLCVSVSEAPIIGQNRLILLGTLTAYGASLTVSAKSMQAMAGEEVSMNFDMLISCHYGGLA